MKRSIFFLAVGFGLGYVKAVSDHEDIRAAALTFQHFLLTFEEEQKAREAAQRAQKEEVPEEEHIEDAVPVPDDEPEPSPQGEIP